MKKEYTLKQDGFRAIWFEGTVNRDKAIIYMGGAGCSEEVTLEMSQYLVKAGYINIQRYSIFTISYTELSSSQLAEKVFCYIKI